MRIKVTLKRGIEGDGRVLMVLVENGDGGEQVLGFFCKLHSPPCTLQPLSACAREAAREGDAHGIGFSFCFTSCRSSRILATKCSYPLTHQREREYVR